MHTNETAGDRQPATDWELGDCQRLYRPVTEVGVFITPHNGGNEL